ncbi:hypothetical protein [Paludisphaera sp.]|uniref:hypothetical protein n=1 Tax=Paludisphaera sp. TaxID=2017432 RepID=UPI00301DD638
MLDPRRRELLSVLEELSEVCPEYRLGQLMANLAMLARGDEEGAIWNLEDDELLQAARKLLADAGARRQPVG